MFTTRTNRRPLFWLMSGLLVVCSLPLTNSSAEQAQATQPQRPPNIIMYLADDIGREAFNSYGGTSYKTPNIDRLAADGMRFTRAYSTALCTPTRVQLLTGQYNFRNYDYFGYFDTNLRTIGNYLQAAGYTTAMAGKWQFGGSFQTPHLIGFNEYLIWQLESPDFWNRYKNPTLTRNGEPAKQHPGAYGPDMLKEFVFDFMQRNRERPFFVYYAEHLTHDPFQPPPGHPDYETHDETNVNDQKYFGAMVSYLDKNVGELMARLDTLGLRENTLVLFMGDNGTDVRVTSMMDGRPVQGDKWGSTDASNHVPFIANWKGTIAPGQVRDDFVDVSDLFATMLEAGRSTILNVQSDGVSLYPTLTRGVPSPRKWIFTDFYRNRTPGPNTVRDGRPHRYVHDGQFKLYADGRFFDYLADPAEKSPLSESGLSPLARSAYQTLREAMTSMEAEIKGTEARRKAGPPPQRGSGREGRGRGATPDDGRGRGRGTIPRADSRAVLRFRP